MSKSGRTLRAPLVVAILAAATGTAAAEDTFRPVSNEELDRFYSQADRQASASIKTAEVLHHVNPAFLGVNMSYFIMTDDAWSKYGFTDRVRSAGMGSLRYPGGQETGFFHWEHPGVNGYEDLWAPEKEHGTAPGRGRFQTTWVAPDKWETNKSFMDFDEFMKICHDTGAEPLVGINLSSGRKFNRRQDGIDEALRWLRYCKEKGYVVKYWYLECEPWNRGSNYTFPEKEYSEDVVAYGRAMKKESPEIKLIINPTGQDGYEYTDWIAGLIRDTKEVADYVDFHWYWEWNSGSFDRWMAQNPVGLSKSGKSYSQAVDLVRKACAQAGAPNMGVVVLEWNLAPSTQEQTFSESLSALIQGEMLMQFLQSGVELTSLWPMLWNSSRDIWPEQDLFPSLIAQDPPYQPTRTLDLFRMLAPVQGGDLVRATTDTTDTQVVAVVHGDKLHLYALNKNLKRRRITVSMDKPITAVGPGEAFALKRQVMLAVEPERTSSTTVRFYAEPCSFNSIELKLGAGR